MSHMLNEIHQQPEIVVKLVGEERANAERLAAEIKRGDTRFVVIAARGTSDHAAIYGKYLLEIKNGIPVALADCSVFTLYDAAMRLDDALVIGISQSGEATDVAEYLERSKALGALTLAITNEPGSHLTRIADHTILCHAGKERGVAATKTYTSTLAAFYLISECLIGECSPVDSLSKCADAMRGALGMQDDVFEKAERHRDMTSGYVLARGFNYCTALEIALKLAETSYLGMIGCSAADFLHGPIAAVHEDQACFLIAPPGKTLDGMMEMASRLRDLKAETVVLSSDDGVLSLASTPFRIEAQLPEELSPLLYIVPAQLFAYRLAVVRGYDPDRPHGLSKVTLTR